MPVLSNARHERFAQALARGQTKVDAYVYAGYKRSDAHSSRLASRQEVAKRVQELALEWQKVSLETSAAAAEKVAEQVILSKTWVLEHLMENALISMGKKALRVRVKSKGSDDTFEADLHFRDAMAANRALELIGREIGAMFIERHEVGGAGDFAALNDIELIERISAELQGNGIDPSLVQQLLTTEKDETAH